MRWKLRGLNPPLKRRAYWKLVGASADRWTPRSQSALPVSHKDRFSPLVHTFFCCFITPGPFFRTTRSANHSSTESIVSAGRYAPRLGYTRIFIVLNATRHLQRQAIRGFHQDDSDKTRLTTVKFSTWNLQCIRYPSSRVLYDQLGGFKQITTSLSARGQIPIT